MKVLVIEDNPEISSAIGVTIQIRWSEAKVVTTHLGERGVEMVETEKPDLVILDLGHRIVNLYSLVDDIHNRLGKSYYLAGLLFDAFDSFIGLFLEYCRAEPHVEDEKSAGVKVPAHRPEGILNVLIASTFSSGMT